MNLVKENKLSKFKHDLFSSVKSKFQIITLNKLRYVTNNFHTLPYMIENSVRENRNRRNK